MRTERPTGTARIAMAAILCALSFPAPAGAGLCGDTSGDGFFRSSDALAALKHAVTSGYDRRGDVTPRAATQAAAGDGKISAGDALESLKAAVEGRIPVCRGANARRAVVSTAPYDFYSSAG